MATVGSPVLSVRAGDRLLPPFCVGKSVAMLKICHDTLALVSSDGKLYLWCVCIGLPRRIRVASRDGGILPACLPAGD